MPHRLRREVVQRYDACHDRRQRCRNLRIGHIGLACFPVDIESMDFRVKRVPHLAYVSGKLKDRASSAYSDVVKALARQPVGDRLDIGVGGAIKPGKFLGREPFLKIRRVLHLLLIHELAQRGLLVRAPLQKQQHTVHRRGIGDGSPIKLGAGERVHVAAQAHELRFVDCLGNACGNCYSLRSRRAIRLCLCGDAKCRERHSQNKNEKGIAKDQRLEFHSPPHTADLNSVPTQSIRTERAAIHTEEELLQRASRGRGLDRKRFTSKRVKNITSFLKTL